LAVAFVGGEGTEMRPLVLVTALATLAMTGAAAAQERNRVTASPTLPEASAAQNRAVDAASVADVKPGLSVFGSDGRNVGRVVEVVRTPAGQINRLLLDAADGKRRALSGADIVVARGRVTTTLNLVQIVALPVVQN
jgi:hypothetical protein